MAALRADILRRNQIAVENHLAAAIALAPKIVGRRGLRPHQAFDPWTDEIGDPVHGWVFSTSGVNVGGVLWPGCGPREPRPPSSGRSLKHPQRSRRGLCLGEAPLRYA